MYTRAGVIAIGVGLTGAGYALYYGLQANGVDPIWAGNIVQLTFVLGLSLAWAWSYVCLLYTSPSPRDAHESRMPSSA